MDASDIYAIDRAMMEADGTKDKSNLGANAILPVSIAVFITTLKENLFPLTLYTLHRRTRKNRCISALKNIIIVLWLQI